MMSNGVCPSETSSALVLHRCPEQRGVWDSGYYIKCV